MAIPSQVGPKVPGTSWIHAVVETPGGSRSKYRYDERLGLFLLHKLLPVGAAFPFDFGFIPGTHADDGDALDIIVLGEEPTFTGCLLTVRVLGVLEAEQTEKGATIRNDRLVGTPETPKIRPQARTLNDVSDQLLGQIEHFFVAYNRAEGREFVVTGRRGPRAAMTRIDVGIRAFAQAQRGSRRKGTKRTGSSSV